MWLTGPAAPRHVESSQTRARTCVPCIGRQTLNHCATREDPVLAFFKNIFDDYLIIILVMIILSFIQHGEIVKVGLNYFVEFFWFVCF